MRGRETMTVRERERGDERLGVTCGEGKRDHERQRLGETE